MYPSQWFGGHRMGNVRREEACAYAVLTKGTRGVDNITLAKKKFSTSEYANIDDACNAANDWLLDKSVEHGLAKNRCRYLSESVIEMQLTGGHTTTFDSDVLENLRAMTWYAKETCGILYAASGQSRLMHRVVTSNEWECVDHIDHDGLNNVRSNLRDGSNGINQFNQRAQVNSSTGILGVTIATNRCGTGRTRVKAQFQFRGKLVIRHATVPNENLDASLVYAGEWVKKRKARLMMMAATTSKRRAR